jgi:hypothetical protein
MQILIWVLAAIALALWSLLSWGLAALLGMDPSWVGDLRGLVDRLPFADALDAWVPGWRAMAVALIGMTETLLGWVGQSAGLVIGLVWALGAVMIAGGAALLSLVVALVRRSSAKAGEGVVQ